MFAKSLVALAGLAAFVAAEPATFTHYGSGDSMGSPNCATTVNACGTPNQQGYTAAISENVFGVGPGAGAGPGCGKCWTLTIDADENGSPVTQKTINVTVNNLCPASGNEEWCQIPAGGTNQHGGQVHFDICSDAGGSDAFFTSVGAGKGTATQIACGGDTASESSAALSSSAAPTSPATSAPAQQSQAQSSYVQQSSEAAPSSTAAAATGSSNQGSGYSAPAESHSAPKYKPSLMTHPFPGAATPSAAAATGSPYEGSGSGASAPESSAAAGAQGGAPYSGSQGGQGSHHGGFPGFGGQGGARPSPVGPGFGSYTPGSFPFGAGATPSPHHRGHHGHGFPHGGQGGHYSGAAYGPGHAGAPKATGAPEAGSSGEKGAGYGGSQVSAAAAQASEGCDEE